ncbi:MAG: radical SAM protein [Holophagales bacterium]|nr:radical SAM protein [Holophagales bacterium]
MGFADVVRKSWEGHHLLSVLIELTYRCNLSCWFCYNDTRREGRALELDDYRRLLGDLAEMGVLQLVLTGGEPLTHPHFFAIGSHARELGFVVRLKSNGHLIDAATARRLREEVDPFVVEVSLHGARAETHERQTRVSGSFDRLLRNLEHAREAGLRLAINSTLTRWNEDEIEAMMELAGRLGLPLNVDPVVTVRDDGDTSPLSIAPSPAGLERLLRLQRERARRLAAAGPAAEIPAPEISVGRDADRFMPSSPAAGSDAPAEGAGGRSAGTQPRPTHTKHCGAGTGGAAIDPFGDVYPCVQWRVPIGNVLETSIREIWRGSPALDRVRRENEEVHRERAGEGEWGKALGFCPGAAALETGSATGIYPAARRRADVTRRLAEESTSETETSSQAATEARPLLPVIQG